MRDVHYGRMVRPALFLLGPWVLLAAAQDDAVPQRESTFPWVSWAPTIQAAAERAKRERRLVLAFLFPWDGTFFESGYEGAGAVRKFRASPPPAALERQRRRDPGYVKEQAVLTALLGNPDLAALVERRFVPVRLRLHTWHFFQGGRGPFAEPLAALGTSVRKTRPPALVVATPEGKLLHRVERMGVFSPYLVYRMLLGVLDQNPRYRAAGLPSPKAAWREAVTQLIEGGNFRRARKRLSTPTEKERAWALLAAARMDALQGKLAVAEAALRAQRPSPERDALLAEVWVRLRRYEEVLKLQERGPHRAYALEKLGRYEEARPLWERIARDEPKGPLGARARYHLQGHFAREWETLADLGADPALETTITGAGDDAAAVRYLLGQQDPNGSWKDARPGPGDLSVARTALCVAALRAFRAADQRCDEAIRRGTSYVTRWSAAPADRVWDLTYALRLELDLYAEEKTRTAGARERIGRLLAGLERIEQDGGWTYTRAPRLHTFNTAPILLLLVRARELGLRVDSGLIDRAAAFLERNRLGKKSLFHYGTTMEHMTPQKEKDLEKAEKSSCFRSPLCELALHAAGARPDTKGIARALKQFFKHHASARATQKIFESYVDVTNMQDSYRYFFGVYYAAKAIEALPDKKRKTLARTLAAAIRAEQELDGSYVDSQMVGKSSSTALALLALATLDAAGG